MNIHNLPLAQAQELGDVAYDVAWAMTGDGYAASTAYEEVVSRLLGRTPDDDLEPCPCCGKCLTPVGTLCIFCETDEQQPGAWRDWCDMREDLRHGG